MGPEGCPSYLSESELPQEDTFLPVPAIECASSDNTKPAPPVLKDVAQNNDVPHVPEQTHPKELSHQPGLFLVHNLPFWTVLGLPTSITSPTWM